MWLILVVQEMTSSSLKSVSNKAVYRWLMLGCFLIALLVVIGGITRLTQSGLSMVKWEPIMGFLPPMSSESWNEAFELYKQSPEFHYYNSNFDLSDFKQIFFWEYLHRLLARVLGLVFIFPCVYFWIKQYFTKKLKRQVLLIFTLGTLQAIIGWFMVKSGLVDQPHVSHYRLATHLITALGLMTYIFWVAQSIYERADDLNEKKPTGVIKIFIFFIFLQLAFGAFVAGLKGGLYYNTFPKMGSNWLPAGFGMIFEKEGVKSLTENPVIVQFVHRSIAYVLIIVLGIIWVKSRKANYSIRQMLRLKLMTAAVLFQFILGVVTLLFAVPVTLGVAHQAGAILLLLSAFYFLLSLKSKGQDLSAS